MCLDFQAFDNPPMPQMLLDNFVDIVFIVVGVPDPFRINRHYRPLAAAVHATGVVDAALSRAVQMQFFNLLLGVIAHNLGAMVRATGAAVFALVGTEEYVVFVVAHGYSLHHNRLAGHFIAAWAFTQFSLLPGFSEHLAYFAQMHFFLCDQAPGIFLQHHVAVFHQLQQIIISRQSLHFMLQRLP